MRGGGGGHAWQGACIAWGMHGGGACWWGAYMIWGGASMAGETAIAVDGTHPTGMYSCLLEQIYCKDLRMHWLLPSR